MSFNAFSHAASKDLAVAKAVPHGLSFAPQALFFGLEAIVAHPAPSSDLTQPLRKSLDELDQHGIHGYFRLKAYMHYHSDVVRNVRKMQVDKGPGNYERYCAEKRDRFWKEHPIELDVVEKDEKGEYYPFKWAWDEDLKNYTTVKEKDAEKVNGTQKNLHKEEAS
ncbi:hypothetical protein SLS61_007482 [Didymella pomorum]